MELHQLVNTFGQDLKRRYGERVRKLTLHGDFSCPNRDGSIGRGGCTFCNVASFADETAKQHSIASQLDARKAEMKVRAGRYLAYFQAYTSTYGEVCQLRRLYDEAIQTTDIVGLCVGTRPDCVPDSVLRLLAEYQQQGYEVWLELGLQTANDNTLKRINRGHSFAAYQDAVIRATGYDLKICTHLIVGLPGESRADHLHTLDSVVRCGVDGIKLHPLHLVEGSKLGQAWKAGRIDGIDLDSYADSAAEMIRHTPAGVVYHRVSASARKPTLLAPDWCENRWLAQQAIAERLNRDGAQGSACS